MFPGMDLLHSLPLGFLFFNYLQLWYDVCV